MTNTTKPVKSGIRERRREEAAKLVTRLAAQREDMIAKLVKLDGRLTGARRTLARYDKLITAAKPKPKRVADVAPATANVVKLDDQLEVPGFLRRAGAIGGKTPADLAKLEAEEKERERERAAAKREGEERDKAAIVEINAAKRETRTRKARGRTERKAAERSGERKAMPLTGKAALAAIKAGDSPGP